MNQIRYYDGVVRELIQSACEITRVEGTEGNVEKLRQAVKLLVDVYSLDEHLIDEFEMDVEYARTQEPKEPPIVIYFDPSGPSGNIYDILGQCQRELRERHRITDYNNLREAVFSSQSYDEALKNVRQFVTLIERVD